MGVPADQEFCCPNTVYVPISYMGHFFQSLETHIQAKQTNKRAMIALDRSPEFKIACESDCVCGLRDVD